MADDLERATLVTVLGTRPEIIKCSTLLPRFDHSYDHVLIHTGQHYDERMDRGFFAELGLRTPDHSLNVGSGPHGAQLARMLFGIEPILLQHQPAAVFVQGDTNSTLAGALAAAKLNIPVVHLEAGCRSFNRAMPEETNRVLIDHISTMCLAPDETASRHLMGEGIAQDRISVVGSTAIDACLRVAGMPAADTLLLEHSLQRMQFLVATIHRAENTVQHRLRGLIDALGDLASIWPVIFPVHPRTAIALDGLTRPEGVIFCEPVSYGQMIQLLRQCRGLLTDSGGLQEEAAVLGTPTFILREETEWMEFVAAGRHQLVGVDRQVIVNSVRHVLADEHPERHTREPIGLERAGATERVLLAVSQLLQRDEEGQHSWNQAALASDRLTLAT